MKTLFCFILLSFLFLSSCSKNDSTTDVTSPTPTTITTSWAGGKYTMIIGSQNSYGHIYTDYFDLSSFSSFVISWQVDFEPSFDTTMSSVAFLGETKGGNDQYFLQPTFQKVQTKNYSITLQDFQLIGSSNFRFHWSSGRLTTTYSNLKIIGYKK